jgi:hypothetical protein
MRVFADAARRLGIEVTLATDRCHVLEDPWGDHAVPVRFEDVPASLAALQGRQFDSIAAVGDRPAVLAAEVVPPACRRPRLPRQIPRPPTLPGGRIAGAGVLPCVIR